MANGAGYYAPLMDEMSKKLRGGVSPDAGEAGTSAGGGPPAAQMLANAMRTGTSKQENREGYSPDENMAARFSAAKEQGSYSSPGKAPSAGQKLADAMKPPDPGNYVFSDLGNAEAGGEQYHYDVTMDGTIQFTSPITGKKVTLKPTDEAPHKQKAYAAIMKQLAKSQKVS